MGRPAKPASLPPARARSPSVARAPRPPDSAAPAPSPGSSASANQRMRRRPPGSSSGSGFVIYHSFQGSMYFVRKYHGKLQADILKLTFLSNLFVKSVVFKLMSIVDSSHSAKSEKYLELTKDIANKTY